MAQWLIIAVGFVYLIVATNLILAGKVGLGIAFLGYAFSNVGLYLAAQ